MLKYLLEKEFKQIMRNSFIPKMIIIFPLVIMLVMPWVVNQEVKNLNICVVDNNHSVLSQRLVQKITAGNYFSLVAAPASNAEALQSIEMGDAKLIFEIPVDFERDLVKTGFANVMITANGVNGMEAGLGSSYLTAIVADFSREMNAENGNLPKRQFQIEPTVAHYKFNEFLDYKVFMIPALMVMLLTMLCGFLPALDIVGEKEIGTIEQINVTPVGKFQFILGKLIPYWVIGLLALSISFGVAAAVYGLVPKGSILTLYLFAVLYILVVSGVGIVVSNYSATMQQAMFVIFFFVIILILVSGLFTPVSSMPVWAQAITRLNPLRYMMEMMRAVFLKGNGFFDLLPQFFTLCGFAVVFNGWAILSYRKSG
jgi:ABC-2 type transport system permease protein